MLESADFRNMLCKEVSRLMEQERIEVPRQDANPLQEIFSAKVILNLLLS